MSAYNHPPEALPPGSKVWIYLRDSGGDSQELSVPEQREELELYCKENKLTITRTFIDEAKSGGDVTKRSDFLEMMEASQHPEQKPDGLLVWDYSRFGRNAKQSLLNKLKLEIDSGIIVHPLKGDAPKGDFEILLEAIVHWRHEKLRDDISRNSKRGKRYAAERGFAPGTPPRGYKGKPFPRGEKRNGETRYANKWVPDLELWDLVKLAWQMRANGSSYQEIQKATKGKLYTSVNSWTAFFSNNSYLGHYGKGDREIKDHHEAAITQEIWDAVQEHKKAYKRSGQSKHPLYNSRRKALPTLLSGLAFCIHCGAAIVHHKGHVKHNWPYYLCGKKDRQRANCEARRIGAKKADRAILDAVCKQIVTPKFINDLLSDITTQLSSIDTQAIDQEISELKGQLAAVDNKISILLDLAENHGAAAALERLKQRESERGQIVLAMRELEAQADAANLEIDPEVLGLVISSWVEKFSELRKQNDIPSMRRHLPRFVSKIELGYYHAKIWYTFPIDSIPHPLPSVPVGASNLTGVKVVEITWS